MINKDHLRIYFSEKDRFENLHGILKNNNLEFFKMIEYYKEKYENTLDLLEKTQTELNYLRLFDK